MAGMRMWWSLACPSTSTYCFVSPNVSRQRRVPGRHSGTSHTHSSRPLPQRSRTKQQVFGRARLVDDLITPGVKD